MIVLGLPELVRASIDSRIPVPFSKGAWDVVVVVVAAVAAVYLEAERRDGLVRKHLPVPCWHLVPCEVS